jgi:hypothetical protein
MTVPEKPTAFPNSAHPDSGHPDSGHPDADRLRIRSRRVAAACGLLAVALPVMVAVTWAVSGPSGMLTHLTGNAVRIAPSGLQVTAAVALSFLPVLVLSYALLAARQCFRAFAEGQLFTDAPAVALKAFGRRILLASALGLVLPTLLGLVLTLNAAPGEGMLAISLSSDQLLGFLLGAIIWLLGDVQGRAARLADEHAQIV